MQIFQKAFDTERNCQYNDKTNKPIIPIQRKHREELAEMKSTGIIRKVDELGRIVLPIELRRTLDIILQKFEPACLFCGSSRNLLSYRRKNVCQECAKKISEY